MVKTTAITALRDSKPLRPVVTVLLATIKRRQAEEAALVDGRLEPDVSRTALRERPDNPPGY